MNDEDAIREDAAVNMLEYIGGRLQELSTAELAEFIKQTEDYARAVQRKGERKEYVEFLTSFADNAGLKGI